MLALRFNGPGFVAFIRDIACTIAGLYGWITQVPKETPNLAILGGSMACLGVVGASGGMILRRFFMDLVSSQSQQDSSSPPRSTD